MSKPTGGPAGIGTGKPVHPFAVTVEEPVAVSLDRAAFGRVQ